MENYNYIAKKIEGKKITEYVLEIEELNPNDIAVSYTHLTLPTKRIV